jgi:hypothetical protein
MSYKKYFQINNFVFEGAHAVQTASSHHYYSCSNESQTNKRNTPSCILQFFKSKYNLMQ